MEPGAQRTLPLHELEDTELVALARAGHEEAFARLVVRHVDRFRAIAGRIVRGRHADVDDVVQEAVVRIWRNLDGFRGDARFTTWSYRIVTNVALDRVRRGPRETPVERIPERADHLGPARHVIAREDLARGRVVLERLPKDQVTCLVLSQFHDLEQHEIAALLGTSVSGVKNRVYRARRQLTRELAADAG